MYTPAFYPLNSNDLRFVVYAGSDQELVAQRRPNVHVQGLGTSLDEAPAYHHLDLCDLRTTEESSRLDQRIPGQEQECVNLPVGNGVPGKEGFCNVCLDILDQCTSSPIRALRYSLYTT